MEGDGKNKGSYDSLSFPIMGARGLMREETEESRAGLMRQQNDNYIKWYQDEYQLIK